METVEALKILQVAPPTPGDTQLCNLARRARKADIRQLGFKSGKGYRRYLKLLKAAKRNGEI